MKNKKTWIIFVTIIIVIVALTATITIVLNNKKEKQIIDNFETKVESFPEETLPIIRLSELIDLEDIQKSTTIETKEVDEKISEKYSGEYNGSLMEAKAVTEAGKIQGKIFFIRNNQMNANIFQVKMKLKEDKNKIEQITQNIEDFKSECLSQIEIDDINEPSNEILLGKSQYNFTIPTEESIYVEKRLYSLTYKVEPKNFNIKRERILEEQKRIMESNDALPGELEHISMELEKLEEEPIKIYDMNFYMDSEYLVCEFVRIF